MKCSVCGASVSRIFDYGNIPLCDAYSRDRCEAVNAPRSPLSFVECASCSHIELELKPSEERIYTNYTYRSGHSPDLDLHFGLYAKQVIQLLPPYSSVLDIGCNDGLLLDHFKRLGLKTFGVEPSPASRVASSGGHLVQSGYFGASSPAYFGMKFQAVTINNVLANVRDLDQFVAALGEVLADDGYVIVETLCSAVLLRRGIFEMFNHEHFHYFSGRSICTLFSKVGLSISSAEFFATKGGTMRLVFSRRPVSKVGLLELFTPNEADISLFLSRINAERDYVERFLSALSVPPIVFGSYAGTTILSALLFPQLEYSLIWDDNSSRWGMYSPGVGAKCSAPITQTGDFSILVAAWRFYHTIERRHPLLFTPDRTYVINSKAY